MSSALATARRTASKSAMLVVGFRRAILRHLLLVFLCCGSSDIVVIYIVVIISVFNSHAVAKVERTKFVYFVGNAYIERLQCAGIYRRHSLGFFMDGCCQDVFGVDNLAIIYQVHPQAQTLQFFYKHVKAFWYFRPGDWLFLDDRLVRFGTAVYVVGLNGKHFLQGVCRAVCFERPYLHLTKALTTVLRLTAQRLLGDHGVWANRTSMDLIGNHVVQF